MGLFSAMDAAQKVAKLQSGGKEELSISGITNIIINLGDAKRNLTQHQYNAVFALYKALDKCHSKLEMDLGGYYEQAAIIIGIFNQVAPYEKYSGMEKTEAAFFFSSIKSSLDELQPKSKDLLSKILQNNPELNEYFPQEEKDIELYLLELANKQKSKNDDYVSYIMKSCPSIAKNHATMFIGLLAANERYGKEKTLELTDRLFEKWITTESLTGFIEIPFLCGALYSNGVVTKEESSLLSKKYSNLQLMHASYKRKSPSPDISLEIDKNTATRDPSNESVKLSENKQAGETNGQEVSEMKNDIRPSLSNQDSERFNSSTGDYHVTGDDIRLHAPEEETKTYRPIQRSVPSSMTAAQEKAFQQIYAAPAESRFNPLAILSICLLTLSLALLIITLNSKSSSSHTEALYFTSIIFSIVAMICNFVSITKSKTLVLSLTNMIAIIVAMIPYSFRRGYWIDARFERYLIFVVDISLVFFVVALIISIFEIIRAALKAYYSSTSYHSKCYANIERMRNLLEKGIISQQEFDFEKERIKNKIKY